MLQIGHRDERDTSGDRSASPAASLGALVRRIVLMDIRVVALDGIEATQAITTHEARVVVLTTFDLDEYGSDGRDLPRPP